MATQRKGVTVVTLMGNGIDDVHFENGTDISVLDSGHLYVYDDGGNNLAIYAPGRWASAVVNR